MKSQSTRWGCVVFKEMNSVTTLVTHSVMLAGCDMRRRGRLLQGGDREVTWWSVGVLASFLDICSLKNK